MFFMKTLVAYTTDWRVVSAARHSDFGQYTTERTKSEVGGRGESQAASPRTRQGATIVKFAPLGGMVVIRARRRGLSGRAQPKALSTTQTLLSISYSRQHRKSENVLREHFTFSAGRPARAHPAPGNTAPAPDTFGPPPHTSRTPRCDRRYARRTRSAVRRCRPPRRSPS